MKQGQQAHDREDENVLHQPWIAVLRMDRQPDPENGEQRSEDQQVAAMRHLPVPHGQSEDADPITCARFLFAHVASIPVPVRKELSLRIREPARLMEPFGDLGTGLRAGVGSPRTLVGHEWTLPAASVCVAGRYRSFP